MTTSLPVNLAHARDIHPDIDVPLVRDANHPERALWSAAELHRLTSLALTMGASWRHGRLRP
ncbi:hypothetical protein [Nocardia arthritidis]|uniref:hypothetical protein n=1 Tax=Nocardia arthritidis TaxID=228602 RepID=UPI000A7356D0|nr:hypothetical protein [Nocardia arthritidis]